MSERNIIYCVHCGSKNLKKDIKCNKCHKKLKPHNELFKNYLIKHVKDDLKGKVTDNVFSIIKNYIISHLYGASVFMALLFVGTSIIVHNNYNRVNYIKDKSEMLINNLNKDEVLITFYTYDDYDGNFPSPTTSGYIITGNLKEVGIIKLKKDSSLKEWCEENKEHFACNVEISYLDKSLDKTSKEYKELAKEYNKYFESNNCAQNFKSCSKKYEEYNKKLNDYMNILTNIKEDKVLDLNTRFNKNIDLFVAYIEN